MPERDGAASLDSVASAFARACDNAGVRYAFVGGMAVIAWGQPRTTSDIDALVELSDEVVFRFARALQGESLEAAVEDLRAAARDRSHVTVFTRDPILSVDIKPASTEHERREIMDSFSVPLPTGPVRVARPEDTVAYKVLFGSEQDLQDARSIVARQGKRLDRERLRDVSQRLGVGDDVDALVREVDEVLGE